MRTLAARLEGRDVRIACVASRFNEPVSLRLLEGCVARLEQLGCQDVDVVWVPGAFEIPLAARTAAETGRYDAVIALGAVIRGETEHFDYVCRAVTDGVREVGLSTRVPVLFCVLTTGTAELAFARAAQPGEPGMNKGEEAAEAAVEIVGTLRALREGKGD
jgi:6,7-dimethyl-8-ribityllumazine synthase